MKVSLIVPILNSHEVVRRQILHFSKMNLPDDLEILFMDDGSDPPLYFSDHGLKNLQIIPTHDSRQWSQEVARNLGAEIARGEYLIMVDVDYIIPQETLNFVMEFSGDKMYFRRRFGILDEGGNLKYDNQTLEEWGVIKKWMPTKKRKFVPGHRNNFVIRRDLFWGLGGYREDRVGKAYPIGGGPDSSFFNLWKKCKKQGIVFDCEDRPEIFVFPNGKFCGDYNANPFGLFHNLKRDWDRTRKTNKQRRNERS